MLCVAPCAIRPRKGINSLQMVHLISLQDPLFLCFSSIVPEDSALTTIDAPHWSHSTLRFLDDDEDCWGSWKIMQFILAVLVLYT